MDLERLQEALRSVQEIIQADGGDLLLEHVDGGFVHLQLVVETADCAECVLPRPMLEQVAAQMLRPAVPGLEGVVVHDPRERPDA